MTVEARGNALRYVRIGSAEVYLDPEGAPFKLGLSEDFDPAVHSAHIHLGVSNT